MDARLLCPILFLVVFSQTTWAIAPQIVSVKTPEALEEGQRLLILCAVQKGTLPISFSWRKNNVLLVPSAEIKIQRFDDYQEQLQILSLSPRHVGNYTCAVKNLHGSDQISVPVVMNFGPRWKAANDGQTVSGVAGETLTLDCSAIGYPAPNVTIQKGQPTIESFL